MLTLIRYNPHINNISGVDGTVFVLGTLDLKVQIGKRQVTQRFLLYRDPITGYHFLLKHDLMAVHAQTMVVLVKAVCRINGSRDDAILTWFQTRHTILFKPALLERRCKQLCMLQHRGTAEKLQQSKQEARRTRKTSESKNY